MKNLSEIILRGPSCLLPMQLQVVRQAAAAWLAMRMEAGCPPKSGPARESPLLRENGKFSVGFLNCEAENANPDRRPTCTVRPHVRHRALP